MAMLEKPRKIITVQDLDRWLLDRAKKMPRAMNASQGSGLTQDQLNQLMNDPQIQELGGNLYIAKNFSYVIPTFAFAGNGTLGASLQIDSDADFQLLMLIGDYTSSAVTIAITEGGAGGLAWQSNPVPIDCFLGTAQLPFPAGLIPQLMPKKRVYNISVVNTSGAANNVNLVFWGYKLYPAEQAAQLGAAPSNS
jgi:hypothetical protein